MVYDHYMIVKLKCGATTGVWQQFRSFVKDQRARFACKDLFQFFCCCCSCMRRCKKREELKYPDEILNTLLQAVEFEKKDRQTVRSSVLGPKIQRKQLETLMFTGQEV